VGITYWAVSDTQTHRSRNISIGITSSHVWTTWCFSCIAVEEVHSESFRTSRIGFHWVIVGLDIPAGTRSDSWPWCQIPQEQRDSVCNALVCILLFLVALNILIGISKW